MFLVSMTRAPGRLASLLLGALVLGVAAPAAAQPRSAPPSSPPPAEGEVEDPYAGEPEDPYGKPNPPPAPAERPATPPPAARPSTPPSTPPPAARPSTPATPPATPPAARPSTPPAAPPERPAVRPPAPPAPERAPDARTPTPEQAIDEAVARALYERARVLHDAGDFASAKMLLLESLSRSGDGPVSGDAKALLASCEENLGDLPSQSGDETLDPFAVRDLEATLDPFAETTPDPAAAPVQDTGASAAGTGPSAQRTLMFYGGLYGFTAGMAVAGVENDDEPLLPGLLGAGAGAAAGYLVARNGSISAGQASTIAWSGVWSGLAGGLVTDLSGVGTSTATGVMRGAALGGLLGTGAGWFLAKKLDPSPGDAALVNSLGLYGTATSFFIGVGLAPVEVEGYSLNALIGAGVGLAVGLYAAPRVDVSRQRMLWVDLGAALGAAAPWVLIYPAIQDSLATSDEQTAGVLSALGLLAGGYLSWRMTAKLEADEPAAEPAPALTGLLQHGAEGGWALGVPLPRLPHNTELGPPSRGWGMALDLVAGQF
jgi:hypothetical protein